jgi:hypothetical protein
MRYAIAIVMGGISGFLIYLIFGTAMQQRWGVVGASSATCSSFRCYCLEEA